MSIYEKILKKEYCMSIIGLGYVGLPLAIEFSKKVDVIGFDIDDDKISNYKNNIDEYNIVDNTELDASKVIFTSDKNELSKSMFHIVAVPTPIYTDNTPDLRPLESVSKMLGKLLKKGSYIVYESTVYPGVTEEVCIPILEEYSGLVCGVDFKVGYSPERINPGDKVNTVTQILKVVSGIDDEALKEIAKVYEIVIKAGVYKAKSIKVAEASKALENAQRDINIGFINEMSMFFNKLGIDTYDVLEASSTKWNFLNFSPGLVGGHCIGVDPYYLKYKSEQIGYHPEILLAGRRTNDLMGRYIGEKIIELIAKEGKVIKNSKVLIMGFTFKENVSDIRNTKVVDIIKKLHEFDIDTTVVDPWVNKDEALNEYGVNVGELSDASTVDAVVWAVPHNSFKNINLKKIKENHCDEKCVFMDIKAALDPDYVKGLGMTYWRL